MPERMLRRYGSRFEAQRDTDLIFPFSEPERQLEALWIFHQPRPHHRLRASEDVEEVDENAPFAALADEVLSMI